MPTFHTSLLTSHAYIFIPGGFPEVGDIKFKNTQMSRFSLHAKNSEVLKKDFKKDFAKVKPRSSHSMCEVGDSIYILGGYGPGEG